MFLGDGISLTSLEHFSDDSIVPIQQQLVYTAVQ